MVDQLESLHGLPTRSNSYIFYTTWIIGLATAMTKRYFKFAALALMSIGLSACGSNPPRSPEPLIDTTEQPTQSVVQPVTIDGVMDQTAIDPNTFAGQAPLERVIYFDYDTSELRSEFLDIVSQHGRFLSENPDASVRLEGHTDERGTREYNIGLGEARATSVFRMLQLQGVNPQQLRVVSYGEELPVDEAHNSDAWAKNRRVNIIYEANLPN